MVGFRSEFDPPKEAHWAVGIRGLEVHQVQVLDRDPAVDGPAIGRFIECGMLV